MNTRTRALGALFVLLFLAQPVTSACAQGVQPGGETPTVFSNPDLVRQYQQTITPEDLASHLYLFASDYFEGRETGMPGQKLAARYLASQYRHMGLAPRGTVETDQLFAPEAYFQPFPVYGRRLNSARLQVSSGGRTVASSLFSPEEQDGLAFLASGERAQSEGGVAFVGYGIADDGLGYDDYAAAKAAGLDLNGKWLLMLGGEPMADSSTSLLPTPDGAPSRWATNWREKVRAALTARNPAGLLIVGGLSPRSTMPVSQLANRAGEALSRSAGDLSLDEVPVSGGGSVPVYYISPELANRILAPTGQTIAKLQRTINSTRKPVVQNVNGVTIESTIDLGTARLQAENVLAFIEGSDPALKDEVVVLSSHYDHEGINPALPGDNIYNGADDDGSGTVTILEIAEAFMTAKRAGHGPRRSILFMNVAGEEKGLLGSEFYADRQPVIPIEQTVANLNIDMIGRFDPTHPTKSENYVYIIGSNLISQELHDINVRANQVTGTGLELDERFNSKDDPNRFYARSDHWNFGKYGVPFIFFFTGTHEDYHGVDDEPHKIEYERMSRIARLIFATAWQVANQDERPAKSGKGFN